MERPPTKSSEVDSSVKPWAKLVQRLITLSIFLYSLKVMTIKNIVDHFKLY